VSSGQLPRWVSDDLARVTPKAKLGPAGDRLMAAAEAFAAGKHGRALRLAEQAKELSPRDATIRELLALSAYRLGRWDVALRELRTYRRYTGDTTHLAVEMDVLRALGRPDDVDSAWDLMERLGGSQDARNEARVVYAAHLLDRGEDRRAWDVANPGRIIDGPRESELRVWYVAARAAARLGDRKTARRLYEAVQQADPAFPGLDELDEVTRR
jgi:tetratricopeptide (TPR) repeat protein